MCRAARLLPHDDEHAACSAGRIFLCRPPPPACMPSWPCDSALTTARQRLGLRRASWSESSLRQWHRDWLDCNAKHTARGVTMARAGKRVSLAFARHHPRVPSKASDGLAGPFHHSPPSRFRLMVSCPRSAVSGAMRQQQSHWQPRQRLAEITGHWQRSPWRMSIALLQRRASIDTSISRSLRMGRSARRSP